MEYVVFACALVCIVFGFYQNLLVRKNSSRDDNINKIAGFIRKGAMAYLKRQYIVIAVYCVCMVTLISLLPGLGVNTAIAFAVGAVFSVLAGFIGMRAATRANAATATAAAQGIKEALKIAFSGGSVLGLFVVGLGALGLGLLYKLTEICLCLQDSALGRARLHCSAVSAEAYIPRLRTWGQTS